MTSYIPLLKNNLIEDLENENLSRNELVNRFLENDKISMKDIDKANKKIIKKYGKNNVKSYKFPVQPGCSYAYQAHSQCLCLYVFYRPKFYNNNLEDEDSDQDLEYNSETLLNNQGVLF